MDVQTREQLLMLDTANEKFFVLMSYRELIDIFETANSDTQWGKETRNSTTKRILENLITCERTALEIIQTVQFLREKCHIPTISQFDEEQAEVKKYKQFYAELEIQCLPVVA